MKPNEIIETLREIFHFDFRFLSVEWLNLFHNR